MSVAEQVETVLQALYGLEDVLDEQTKTSGDDEQWLKVLVRRWQFDTSRKIQRAGVPT